MYAAIVTCTVSVGRPWSKKPERAILHRVELESATLLTVSSVPIAATLAICLLALVGTTTMAEATSLPQNGKIVFDSNGNTPENTNPERDLEIFTMDSDGSDIEQLTDNGTDDLMPAFSPGGERIAFVSTRDGSSEIYTMYADGSNQTRLTNNASGARYPAFFPDGERIVFATDRDANFEIYVMNADGSNETRLTHDQGGLPSFSPDGKKITFVSTRDGNEEVYVMDRDGSHQTRLTNNPASDRAFDWQPLTPKSRSMAVHPPDTGGLSLLLVASALTILRGVLFYAGVRRRM